MGAVPKDNAPDSAEPPPARGRGGHHTVRDDCADAGSASALRHRLGEPFASLMAFLEIFSFDLEMLSFDCVTRMNPVASFAIRVLTTPGILLTALVVSLIHAALLAWRNCFRRYGSSLSLQIHALHLLKTWGALFMVLFIVLFSMILAPFQCRLHPNGRYTVQTYRSVHCDEDEQHLRCSSWESSPVAVLMHPSRV